MTAEQRDDIGQAVTALGTSDISIRSVDFEEREEPGEHYVLVQVKLAPPGSETWPADAFYEFRRSVRELIARRLGEGVDFQLTYVPEATAAVEDDADADAAPDAHSKPVGGDA
ncbi:hypothetical protein [Geodermatophilus ruber]|nr:hypothetical protein [Geodermatophilus ruber]